MISHCLRTLSIGTVLGFALLTGCSTFTSSSTSRGPYTVVAHKPKNPSAVRVKVSLQSRMVYVLEGNRPLLITPTTIGKAGATTPIGTFHVTEKVARKRSNTYGFWAKGGSIVA